MPSAFGAIFFIPWYFCAAIVAIKQRVRHLAVYRFRATLLFRATGTGGAFASGFCWLFGFCGFCGYTALAALVGCVKTAALKNNAGSAIYQTAQLFFAAFGARF